MDKRSGCSWFEQEGALRIEVGEAPHPHLLGCSECREADALYRRIASELPRAHDVAAAPPPPDLEVRLRKLVLGSLALFTVLCARARSASAAAADWLLPSAPLEKANRATLGAGATATESALHNPVLGGGLRRCGNLVLYGAVVGALGAWTTTPLEASFPESLEPSSTAMVAPVPLALELAPITTDALRMAAPPRSSVPEPVSEPSKILAMQKALQQPPEPDLPASETVNRTNNGSSPQVGDGTVWCMMNAWTYYALNHTERDEPRLAACRAHANP